MLVERAQSFWYIIEPEAFSSRHPVLNPWFTCQRQGHGDERLPDGQEGRDRAGGPVVVIRG